MLNFAILLAAPLAFSFNPVVAGGSGPNQDAAKDPNRRVCRSMQVTGTRLGGKKVCKTAAEWEAEANEHRELLEEALPDRK